MKFLRNALLVLSLVLIGRTQAAAQVFDWVQLARNAGNNSGYSPGSCTDRAGNTYAFIGYSDSARVGTQWVRGGARALVKYDSLGRVSWVKVLGNLYMRGQSITPDPAGGGVFVAAYAYGNATWGGAPLPGGSGRSFFGKCSAAGALLWATTIPGDANTGVNLGADGLGSLYLVGETSINRPLTNAVGFINGVRVDTTAAFLLKASPAGAVQWVHLLAGRPLPYSTAPYALRLPNGMYRHAVAGRPGGGCVVYGEFQDSLTVDGAPVFNSRSSAPSADSYLLHFDPTGAMAWARPGSLGGTPTVPVPNPNALAVDLSDNYYVTGSSNLGLGAAKYTDAGALVWVRNAEPSATPTNSEGTQIAVDDAGQVTILALTHTFANVAAAVIGGYLLDNSFSLIHFDQTGQLKWAIANGLSTSPPPPDFFYYDQVSLGADAAGNVYLTSETGSNSTTGPGGRSTIPPVVRLGSFTKVGAGVIVARIGSRHNTVRGYLYLDANGNGTRDAAEGPFPQTLVVQTLQPTYNALGTREPNGDFNVYTGAGAYTLPAPPAPLHYALTQPTSGGYSGSFAGYGGIDSARHFGYRPVASQADVRVQLTPYGAARPGFLTRYRVTVENVGTTTIASGTATATLDGRADYVSSTPSGARAGQTVTWTYGSLAPFARREFDVLFSLPTNTVLGTVLNSTATAPLAADVVPVDNTTSATQTVTGSFDPNDITVNYTRLTPAQVAASQPLDYTIRFQNMGTDTAFTVVVKDTLDFRKLALNSLQLVAQSHNCIWSLTGQGELTVRFLNINLPYRNVDVIRSQGFVRFRVQPRSTLAVGEIIPNKAGIVFDYNSPVVTNTATTTVFLATAALARHDAAAWDAYPNPATDALTVSAELAVAGPVRLELLDALGRTVRQQTLKAPAGSLRQMLDLRGLARGLYVLRLTPPTGPPTSRQVVRE